MKAFSRIIEYCVNLIQQLCQLYKQNKGNTVLVCSSYHAVKIVKLGHHILNFVFLSLIFQYSPDFIKIHCTVVWPSKTSFLVLVLLVYLNICQAHWYLYFLPVLTAINSFLKSICPHILLSIHLYSWLWAEFQGSFLDFWPEVWKHLVSVILWGTNLSLLVPCYLNEIFEAG